MKVELEVIEELTGEQLRKLPVGKGGELSDIYIEGVAEELEDDDEISVEECGFMKGYLAD